MISKLDIEKLLQNNLPDGYQVISLTISATQDIIVELDRLGGVDLDFCAQLNRTIAAELDKSGEDYSLEVGSVSLTAPFKTKMQYDKHLGQNVEVLAADGKKYRGQLVNVEEEYFEVDIEVMVQVEGKKRKQKQIQTLTFNYNEVKYTKYDIDL